MVALHSWMRGRVPIRSSKDADILVNVRLASQGTAAVSQALVRDGYELNERSVEGHGHSFARGEVSFDVLALDGLGSRALLVTIHNFRTVTVPGGTQALHRTAPVDVRTRSVTGTVPLPDLLGAILVKVRAIDVDDVPDAQRSDVGFLLSLVEDPDELPDNARHRSGDGFGNIPTSAILTTPAGTGSLGLKTGRSSTAGLL